MRALGAHRADVGDVGIGGQTRVVVGLARIRRDAAEFVVVQPRP